MFRGNVIPFILPLITLLMLSACSTVGKTSETINSVESRSNSNADKEIISGNLTLYTSQPDADAQAIVDAFTEQYPEVEIAAFRSGTEEVISKVQAEKQAGDIQADILLVADAVTFESLKEQDLLLSYQSSEAAKVPENFVDADGMYTGTKLMATALIVNTNKISEMPTSWNVLTSKEAKGETVMPSPLYSGAAAYNLGVITRDSDFGWEYYESLKTNKVMVTEGNGAVLKAVAAGEKSYGMIVDFIAARAKKDGSPVELVYPSEGVPVITEPIGIIKNTDNESAAKAFVDFVLSEEGQQLAAKLGYTPIREGIEAPKGLKVIEEMKIIEADEAELYQSREQDKQKFSTLFGG